MSLKRRACPGPGSLLIAATLSLGLVACERKHDTPPPPSGLPPLTAEETSKVVQPTGAEASHAPSATTGTAGALPPGHPSIDPNGATPADVALDPKATVSGVIKIDDKIKAKVAQGDTLYIVARVADQPGPPVAVKRLTVGKFPMQFELDNRDAMIEGTKMTGKITLSARVDKDGDAMTKNPGDVTGQKTVELPANKVVLTLDTVL